jgi:hypothetical protein
MFVSSLSSLPHMKVSRLLLLQTSSPKDWQFPAMQWMSVWNWRVKAPQGGHISNSGIPFRECSRDNEQFWHQI